jgi:DNA end-binding protein Ku
VAAPRPYWKGHLRLSLVSIAVELYPAIVSSSRPAMHQIHRPSSQRIRYQKSVPGIGPVDASDIARGVEVEDDTYVIIEPSELDEIKLESQHTLDLVQFVDQCEVDPRYFERPFYLVPGSDISAEGFAVMRAALREERKIGLGQMTMRGEEYLVALRPCGRGLLLETMRYENEVRASDKLFEDIPPDSGLDSEKTALAQRLIKDRTRPFDASAFHDSYADALHALIEEKRGKRHLMHAQTNEPRKSAEIVDLMEALKKSVARQRASSTAATKKKKAVKSSGHQTAKKTRRAI